MEARKTTSSPRYGAVRSPGRRGERRRHKHSRARGRRRAGGPGAERDGFCGGDEPFDASAADRVGRAGPCPEGGKGEVDGKEEAAAWAAKYANQGHRAAVRGRSRTPSTATRAGGHSRINEYLRRGSSGGEIVSQRVASLDALTGRSTTGAAVTVRRGVNPPAVMAALKEAAASGGTVGRPRLRQLRPSTPVSAESFHGGVVPWSACTSPRAPAVTTVAAASRS